MKIGADSGLVGPRFSRNATYHAYHAETLSKFGHVGIKRRWSFSCGPEWALMLQPLVVLKCTK